KRALQRHTFKIAHENIETKHPMARNGDLQLWHSPSLVIRPHCFPPYWLNFGTVIPDGNIHCLCRGADYFYRHAVGTDLARHNVQFCHELLTVDVEGDF